MANKTAIPNLQFINVAIPDNPRITLIQNSLIGSGDVKLSSGITDKDGNAPTLEMMLTFKNTEGKYMQATVPAGNFTDSTTITGMKRGIAKSGIDLETEVAALDIDLLEGTEVVSAIPAQLFQLAYDALRGQIGSSIKHNVAEQYENGIPARIPVYADAATGEAAISSPVNGDRFYATSEGVVREYIGGAWGNSTGIATPNASTTVSGKGEVATSAESKAGTDTGGTGAKMWVLPSDIAKNIQDAVYSYAADAEASDAYAITLTPAVSAYAEGQVFFFKANTANTGAATLNVNGLGAKTIKKLHDQDLEDNDIEAGQMVMVMYDGTNFQMFSPLGTQLTTAQKNTLTGGRSSDSDDEHTHGAIQKLCGVANFDNKDFWNFVIPLSTNLEADDDASQIWYGNYANAGSDFKHSYWQHGIESGASGAYQIYTGDRGGLTRDFFPTKYKDGKDVVCEFGMDFDATGAGCEGSIGFNSATAALQDYDNNGNAVSFSFDTSGNLYAHTGNGASSTETLIGAIDANVHIYRIEFEQGVEARFYIDGVLEETITTTLPTNIPTFFGWGASSGTRRIIRVTQPYFSIEK